MKRGQIEESLASLDMKLLTDIGGIAAIGKVWTNTSSLTTFTRTMSINYPVAGSRSLMPSIGT